MAQAVIIPAGAQTSVIKCKLCENSGEFFCKECPSALCKPCRDKHDKLLVGHSVVSIQTIDRSAFSISCNSQCSKHKQQFKLFCSQCNLLICIACVPEEHNGHSTSLIEKIVEKMRESAAGNVSLMTERIEKLSEVLEKTNSEKLPKLEVDLQAASRDIDSTLKSIQQVIEDKKDIKTTEYEDYKKLQDMDIKRELKRRENVLTEYRNLYNSIEKMLAEDHAVTFYISYNNLRKDIDDFDEEILKDIDLPHVPEFESESFVEEIVHAISAKFELRVSSTSNSQQQEVRQLKLELNNIRSKENSNISELNQQKEGLTKTIGNLEKQIEDLNNRLSTNTVEHQQEIRQLKHEYTSKRSKENAQMSELKEKQNEFREQKIRKLEEQVQDLNKRLSNNTDGHQQEIRQLNQEFSSTRVKDSSHISELTKQKEVLEQRTRKLEEEVQDLKNRLSDNTDGHLQEIHQLKQELSSTRTNAKGHVSQLQSQKDDLEQKTRNLEKEAQDLKNRLSGTASTHQQEVNRLTQELTDTRGELSAKLFELTNQNKGMEQTAKEREEQNPNNRIYWAEQSQTEAHRQIEGYKQEASKANTTIQTYQQQITGYKEEASKANTTIQTYQQQIEGYCRPFVCKYMCPKCCNMMTSNVSQGMPPSPQIMGMCMCGVGLHIYCGSSM